MITSVSVILLTGAPGTGKTTLARELGRRLPNWQSAGIDQFKNEKSTGWPEMVDLVRHLETHAILESVALPRPYRQALARHRVACVTVLCTERTRIARLAGSRARGDGPCPRRDYPLMRGARHFQFNTELGVRPKAVDYLLGELGLAT